MGIPRIVRQKIKWNKSNIMEEEKETKEMKKRARTEEAYMSPILERRAYRGPDNPLHSLGKKGGREK